MTMSSTDSVSEYTQFYRRERPKYVVASRKLGPLEIVGLRQPAGAHPDPAMNGWLLQALTFGNGILKADFGADKFVSNFTSGQLALSTCHTDCRYELNGDHEVVAIVLPYQQVTALLRDTSIKFSNDFGRLHTNIWQDNRVYNLVLRTWRDSLHSANETDGDDRLLRIAMLIAQAAQHTTTPPKPAYKLSPHVRKRVTDFIEANCEQPLALFKLAEIAELSPYHFARAFKADTGDTLHQYVMRRRFSKAYDLVRNTRLSLTEIAFAVGYSSQQRLCDAFVAQLGTSPSTVRQ
jgi:AraC family transcriptional regulator